MTTTPLAKTVPVPGSTWMRVTVTLLKLVVGLLLPTLAYYALRLRGFGVYVSLLVSTVMFAVPGAVSLLRHRRLDTLSTYITAMLLGSLAVSLVPATTRSCWPGTLC